MDTDCNTRISAADAMKLDWLKTAHKEGRKLMLVPDCADLTSCVSFMDT